MSGRLNVGIFGSSCLGVAAVSRRSGNHFESDPNGCDQPPLRCITHSEDEVQGGGVGGVNMTSVASPAGT